MSDRSIDPLIDGIERRLAAKQTTDRVVGFTSGARLSPPKATLTITQNDIDIANDICEAIEQQISPELRVKLFNQAVVRVAMERLK